MTEQEKKRYQRAVQEVALAYYYKNPYMQYEARELTIQGKWSGMMRNTHYAPPEYASADSEHFSQCTDFICDVYHEAFGYAPFNHAVAPGTGTHMIKVPEDDPMIVYRWWNGSETTMEQAHQKLREILEPGDWLSTNGILKDGRRDGHLMLYLGDCFGDGVKRVIHCCGKALDPGRSFECERRDRVEQFGSLRFQNMEHTWFTPGERPFWDLTERSHVGIGFTVVRPIMAKDFTHTITPATLSRMRYPRMAIDRRADKTKYNELVQGERLTVTLEIKNFGTEPYSRLKVVENLPENVTIVSSTGGTVSGKSITWLLNVPADEARTVSYTVTVDAGRGEFVTFPAGMVDEIPTRELNFVVGGKRLSLNRVDALRRVALSPAFFDYQPKDSGDVSFVTEFYRQKLGIRLDLPATIQEYIDDHFTLMPTPELADEDYPEDTHMLMLKPEDQRHRAWDEMTLYDHLGGRYLFTGWDTKGRTLDLKQPFYQPGDIVLTMWHSNRTRAENPEHMGVYLYLGYGKVLGFGDGKLQTLEFNDTIYCILKNNLFVVLRPSLAFDDINRMDS